MSANEVTNNLKGKIITKPQVLKWHVVQVGDFNSKEKMLSDGNVISEPRGGDQCGHKGAENGRHLRLHLRDSCGVDSLQQQFTNAWN